ncbi:hypothetical protein LTR81_019418 [Elasticomyces elasticus]
MLYSWLATSFNLPSTWKTERVLLNFAAVDYEATVFVNGYNVTFHRGGYFAFAVDVTHYLKSNGTNELLVFVHDPTDSDGYVIPIGKQTLRPSHIFYTPCSGIWQSVWIESAPSNYITQLDISAGMDGQGVPPSRTNSSNPLTDVVNTTVSSSRNAGVPVKIAVIDRNSKETIATHSGTSDVQCTFSVPFVNLWSPHSPTLYDITVTLRDDEVTSYTGFRTISRGKVNGIERPLLNGKFVFQFGTLDQGFWPDGIYLPPNREAMVYDLGVLKELGFNMLRKHIKVEPALFYQACDEMGILLFQDMPSLRPLQQKTLDNCTVVTILPGAAQQDEFARQLELLILDHTRLVDSTSGWYDHGAGDFSDNHHYANPQCGSPFYSIPSSPYDPGRIGIQGEFGGIGQNVSIEHLWNIKDAIDTINQTYEIDTSIEAWNYRGHRLLGELLDQVNFYSCSGGIWTQTTDVEGEVNGLLTYDRRVLRPHVRQWQADIQSLYDAASSRSNNSMVS